MWEALSLPRFHFRSAALSKNALASCTPPQARKLSEILTAFSLYCGSNRTALSACITSAPAMD